MGTSPNRWKEFGLSTVAMKRTGGNWVTRGGLLLAALTMAMLAGSPAAHAEAEPVVSTTGNYCAYSIDSKKLACVEAEKDYPAAKAAALGVDARAQFLLGRFFDNDQYNTANGYIDYFGGGSCTASLSTSDFGWSNTTSWQNRISSFQGYSGCRIRAYEFTSYSGASLGYTTASPNVGVLNDHIWSALFS